MADRDAEELSGEHPASPRLPGSFTLLWSGSAFSQLGAMSASIANPLLALALTGSPVFAGWVTAAATFPSLLLHLPAGVLVDRVDRRRLMMFCQFARMLVALLLVIGLSLTHDPFLLIAAAVLDGLLSALYNVAEVPTIRQVVPDALLPHAMGRNEARSHVALLLGRPLGGLLYDLGRLLPFAANAVCALISLVTLRFVRTGEQECAPHDGDPLRREFRDGLSRLWNDSFLRQILIVCAITNVAFQTLFLLLVVQAERRIDSAAMIGVLFTASGLGGVLGAMAAPRVVRRAMSGPESSRIVPVCVLGWAALTVFVVVFDHPLAGLAAWGGISYIGAHINVALAVYRARVVPRRLLTRVASVNSFVTRGAVPLGAMIAGYVVSNLDTRKSAMAVALVACAVAVWSNAQRFARRPEPLSLVQAHTPQASPDVCSGPQDADHPQERPADCGTADDVGHGPDGGPREPEHGPPNRRDTSAVPVEVPSEWVDAPHEPGAHPVTVSGPAPEPFSQIGHKGVYGHPEKHAYRIDQSESTLRFHGGEADMSRKSLDP
ncbi:MFS transporter [Thermomonospora cellulosilytica]|uniref:MFS family permease n=1 Tax=Thermomonospora cellulosilytica TaxID=1411118 RepID=A0A7W3R9I3_9ACTN|nr:MFS transporter [Thermomonospora cellulosilytica]MBA9004380.1 MFS family permease [Thermomonospora cellulosilytica]